MIEQRRTISTANQPRLSRLNQGEGNRKINQISGSGTPLNAVTPPEIALNDVHIQSF